jgi:hypothetical protein
MEIQIYFTMQKYNLQKKSSTRNSKILQDNYGNSNISPCKNIIFKKNPLQEIPKSFKIS